MKNKIIKTLSIATICLTACFWISGCGNSATTVYNNSNFDIESIDEVNTTNITNARLMVVKHKETGKRFVIYREGYKGGICQLD